MPTKTERQLTEAEFFNLIAPIAIYHRADLMFKKKAQKALRKIRRDFPSILTEHLKCDETTPLDETNNEIADVYIQAFINVVLTEQPDWTTFYDRYGAKGFKDTSGKVVFTGDSSGEFPWYETAELLIDRIEQHVADSEAQADLEDDED
jgi:hypothetical protein